MLKLKYGGDMESLQLGYGSDLGHYEYSIPGLLIDDGDDFMSGERAVHYIFRKNSMNVDEYKDLSSNPMKQSELYASFKGETWEVSHSYQTNLGNKTVIEFKPVDTIPANAVPKVLLSYNLEYIPKGFKCQCGADTVGHPGHSTWCQKFRGN